MGLLFHFIGAIICTNKAISSHAILIGVSCFYKIDYIFIWVINQRLALFINTFLHYYYFPIFLKFHSNDGQTNNALIYWCATKKEQYSNQTNK